MNKEKTDKTDSMLSDGMGGLYKEPKNKSFFKEHLVLEGSA